MLLHLPHLIEMFRPASIVATEELESFNGNTRNASVHSNHQSPGRDIANSTNNNNLMPSIVSGATLYNQKGHTQIKASKNVLKLFKNHITVQKSMGFDSMWNQDRPIIIHGLNSLILS